MPQDQKYLSHNIILQFFAMLVCLVGMLTDEWYTYEETIELMTVNNAGIDPPGQSFETINSELMMQVYAVNTVAPLMISQATLPFLKNSDNARLVQISTGMASLQNRTYGGNYAYCGIN